MVVSSLSVSDYHRELVRRLMEILGVRLVGVYATGSFALGDFACNRSDLDVLAVCRDAVIAAEKRSIVEELRHALRSAQVMSPRLPDQPTACSA
jgi:predicted nucleotidyltransferase